MRVRRIDKNAAAPIDPIECFGHIRPIGRENDDVALGRLIPGPRSGAWPEISDEISQSLRSSGVRDNDAMTSGEQMAADGARYLSGPDKSYFQH